jgi:uncharacterized protein
MEHTLARFVHALRSAELAVSPAETLDAFAVVRQVGIGNPRLLHDALALALAKTPAEKARFTECFDRFFGETAFEQPERVTRAGGRNAGTALERVDAHVAPQTAAMLGELLRADRLALALRLQAASDAAGVPDMQTLRDKRRYADALGRSLGVHELKTVLEQPDIAADADLAALLRHARQYLSDEIQGHLDRQYALLVDASGKRALIDAALGGHLGHLPPDYHREVARVVERLAARLIERHRRRIRHAERGTLDLKRTLRENLAYDGNLFRLEWRARRTRRATVFVVCDLSGSVGRVARFLLMFLHALAEALPNLRLFAFSNRLGEITELFRAHGAERAVEEALVTWGRGTTDYGRAFLDFREIVRRDLDHRSTLIVLGDARCNYFEPRVDVWRALAQRTRRVFWLNPEERDRWGEGDSVMLRYAPCCLRVDRCAQLADIERFADRLLAATRQPAGR